QALRLVRGRRAGARVRRSVRQLQRRGGRGRRGALAPQGGSFDLRAPDARRAGIRSGREGLTSTIRRKPMIGNGFVAEIRGRAGRLPTAGKSRTTASHARVTPGSV